MNSPTSPKAIVKIPDLFAGMNKTEQRRAVELEALKRNGAIRSWRYEAVTLKLADDCRYTPDFFIVQPSGAVLFEEVKGFWRDDAKVKLRVAAKLFPEFTFNAITAAKDGGWNIQNF